MGSGICLKPKSGKKQRISHVSSQSPFWFWSKIWELIPIFPASLQAYSSMKIETSWRTSFTPCAQGKSSLYSPTSLIISSKISRKSFPLILVVGLEYHHNYDDHRWSFSQNHMENYRIVGWITSVGIAFPVRGQSVYLHMTMEVFIPSIFDRRIPWNQDLHWGCANPPLWMIRMAGAICSFEAPFCPKYWSSRRVVKKNFLSNHHKQL